MRNIAKLKVEAIDLADEIKTARLIKQFKLRRLLKRMLNEIEYQEGRKQYANRPYSKQTMVHPEGHTLNCMCGCWKEKRAQFIGI